MKQDFYVYVYKRPNGEPFYVGKGVKKRVHSLSPSRRTRHFNNIVNKYGIDNIVLEFLKCGSEDDAFAWETRLIDAYRRDGFSLTNLTNGGEGVSGRVATAKMREELAKWQGAYHRLDGNAKKKVLEGLARGRAKIGGWQKSKAGIKHIANLKELGRRNLERTRQPREVTCRQCGVVTVKRNMNAKHCSKLCEQRYRRAHGGR